MNYAFEFIELPRSRSQTKPRGSGLTMMIDFGVPLGRQQDILDLADAYVDLAKIAVGTSRLYETSYLTRKLALYNEHEVRPFLGGQFQEYVFATLGVNALTPFLKEARRLGFGAVEVSDNTVPLTSQQRREQIELATECGLSVFGEVGSKGKKTDAATLIVQARECFEAGAELVVVEGAELVEEGQPNARLISDLHTSLDCSRVLIELPGPWVGGMALCDIHDLKKFLIREFGPDVSLGNVAPDDLMETEALRVGLGVVGPAPDSTSGL